MGSFLLKEKKGVFWRSLKGSAIFALGFYTHDALTPDLTSLIKEVEQFSAKAKSVAKMSRAKLAELQKCNKVLDDLMQLYTARIAKLEIAKLEELKKPIDDILLEHVVNRRKNLCGVSYEEVDQKKRSNLVHRMKAEYELFNDQVAEGFDDLVLFNS